MPSSVADSAPPAAYSSYVKNDELDVSNLADDHKNGCPGHTSIWSDAPTSLGHRIDAELWCWGCVLQEPDVPRLCCSKETGAVSGTARSHGRVVMSMRHHLIDTDLTFQIDLAKAANELIQRRTYRDLT